MLKYTVVLASLLVVLVASDEAQARGFRRSRGSGSCPNGQCSAPISTAPAKAVATSNEGGANVAVAVAPEAAVPAGEAAAVAVTANVAVSSTFAPTNARFSRVSRFFQRR